MLVYYCGIVGLKFIYGFVLYIGVMLVELIIDYIGFMVRFVYDIVLLLEVSGFFLYIIFELICIIFYIWYWVLGNFIYGMFFVLNLGI